MACSLDDALTIAADVMFSRLNDETVLLDLKSGTYFGLNDVGTRVWELVERGQPLATIVDTLAEEYAAEHAELARDVLNLADELLNRRLVQLANVSDDRVANR